MIKGKKIAIVGFAKEGLAAANYLSPFNKVTIFDLKAKGEVDAVFFKSLNNSKDIELFLGGSLSTRPDYDFIVRSPGIRPDNELIKTLGSNGAVSTSGTKIFFDYCPARIIGVTGTKGKGTTSSLIYEMLKAHGADVFIGGNIGTPALELLSKLDSKSIVVLELSSFQLLDLQKSPHIAVVLMTTSEHLDWHIDKNEYVKAKENITKYQTVNDFAVVNADFAESAKIGKSSKGKVFYFSTNIKTNGAYLYKGKLISRIRSEVSIETKDIGIPGPHNFQNVMAAMCAAQLLGVNTGAIKKVIGKFKGLPHRLQLVRIVNGVSYYNDSFSTTPETAIAAIKAFSKPKILILGGSSKNSDFSELGRVIAGNDSVKALILIGNEQNTIASAIKNAGKFKGKIFTKLETMPEIVKQASAIAKKGDVVLLTPACASFDMFKNYQDRGDQFISCVKKLK